MSTTFETIISQEGDTVDMIAFERFGVHGMEVAILEANPGLATLDPVLPAGLTIRIPVPEIKDRTALQNIWGTV